MHDVGSMASEHAIESRNEETGTALIDADDRDVLARGLVLISLKRADDVLEFARIELGNKAPDAAFDAAGAEAVDDMHDADRHRRLLSWAASLDQRCSEQF